MAKSIESEINDLIRKIDAEAEKITSKVTAQNLIAGIPLGQLTVLEYISIKEIMETIEEYDLLIGIPSTNARRTDENGINNAELAFIHTNGVLNDKMRSDISERRLQGETYSEASEAVRQMWLREHGSPAYRIPPRPIIEPALRSRKDEINDKLYKALKYFFSFDFDKGERQLNATGLFCQNVVRGWFVNPSNNWPPNSERTKRMKLKRRKLKTGEVRPLIDTGELRKSITYVVRKPERRIITDLIRASNKMKKGASK